MVAQIPPVDFETKPIALPFFRLQFFLPRPACLKLVVPAAAVDGQQYAKLPAQHPLIGVNVPQPEPLNVPVPGRMLELPPVPLIAAVNPPLPFLALLARLYASVAFLDSLVPNCAHPVPG